MSEAYDEDDRDKASSTSTTDRRTSSLSADRDVDVLAGGGGGGGGVAVRALFDYRAQEPDELSFTAGQRFTALFRQEAFEKCWAHSPLRAAARPFTRCRYWRTPASYSYSAGGVRCPRQ